MVSGMVTPIVSRVVTLIVLWLVSPIVSGVAPRILSGFDSTFTIPREGQGGTTPHFRCLLRCWSSSNILNS